MADYTDILSRLRAETGPDRMLDAWVTTALPAGTLPNGFCRVHDGFLQEFALHHHQYGDCFRLFDPGSTRVERYSGSIDAALALVEKAMPGSEYEITTLYGVARVSLPLNDSMFGPSYGDSETGSVPIAILLALFSALQAQEGGNG